MSIEERSSLVFVSGVGRIKEEKPKAERPSGDGIVRIMLLGAPLVINTLLYYFFGFEPAFGYLAVITLLSMVFILPTTSRCVAETTDEPTEASEQNREAYNEEEQA